MTAEQSDTQAQPRAGKVIRVTPAQVAAAKLIVKRADRGVGYASEAVRAMAKARPARG